MEETDQVVVVIEPVLLADVLATENVLPKEKPFRAASYDIHDETYAKTLRAIECDNAAFNTFTENLMDEPRINRYSLLDAIEAYNLLTEAQVYPLSQRFQDEAFNCRPYQPCIIS
jgi:hypothetical protein